MLASATPLCWPQYVAVDGAGNVFLETITNPSIFSGNSQPKRILKIAANTQIVTAVAGNGTTGGSGDGGPGNRASIHRDLAIAADADGNLFLSDSLYARIRAVDAVSGIIRTVAGTGETGSSGDGGPASFAALNSPRGLAVDGAGNVYFVGDDYRVRVLLPGNT
jgi:hypothetical protein